MAAGLYQEGSVDVGAAAGERRGQGWWLRARTEVANGTAAKVAEQTGGRDEYCGEDDEGKGRDPGGYFVGGYAGNEVSSYQYYVL